MPDTISTPIQTRQYIGQQLPKLNRENIWTSALFVSVVALFSLASFYKCITPAPAVLVHENRAPNAFPKIHSLAKDSAKFASGFEAFLNDRFPARSELVSARSWLLLHALGTPGASIVGLGSNNYMFFFQPNVLHAQINYNPLSDSSAKIWADGLNTKREYLAAHGIKFVFLAVPEKGSVYPENLPKGLERKDKRSCIDGIQHHLRKDTGVDFIDVKNILLQAKANTASQNKPLYYLRDTHWNKYGALLVMNALTKYFAMPMPAYKISAKSFEGDLVRMLSLESQLNERVPEIEISHPTAQKIADEQVPYFKKYEHPSWAYQSTNKAQPRTFIIHDSFINNFLDFINEMSSYSLYCWTREFDSQAILEQKPNIVIEEVCERYLYDVNPPNVPQSVNIVQKPVNPYATIGDSAGHPALAEFNERFELVDVSASRTAEGGLVYKLLWRSHVKQKLNGTVQLHMVTKEGKQITERQYAQDSLGRSVDSGSEWLDTIALSADEVKNASQLGVILYEPTFGCQPVQAKQTDSSASRVLLPLSNSLENESYFEKLFCSPKANKATLH